MLQISTLLHYEFVMILKLVHIYVYRSTFSNTFLLQTLTSVLMHMAMEDASIHVVTQLAHTYVVVTMVSDWVQMEKSV